MNINPVNGYSCQPRQKINTNPSFGVGFHPELKAFYKSVREQLPIEQRQKVKSILKTLRENKVLQGWTLGIKEDWGFHITAKPADNPHIEKPVTIWHLASKDDAPADKINLILECLTKDLNNFKKHAEGIFENIVSKKITREIYTNSVENQKLAQEEFLKKHPHLKGLIFKK